MRDWCYLPLRLSGPPGSWMRVALCCITLALGGCRVQPWRRGPCPESLLECRQLTQQALAAQENGRWDDAQRLLTDARAASPEDAVARRQLAQVYWQRGAQREALAELDEALRLAPDDAQAHALRARFDLQQGKYSEALQQVDQALALDNRGVESWALRAEIMRAQGDPRAALGDLHRALAYAPQDASIYRQLAECYLELGEPRRALANLQSCQDQFTPGEEPREILALLGVTSNRLGRFDDASGYFLAASQRGAPSAELLAQLAEAHLLAGRAGEARLAVNQALALDPGQPLGQSLSARMQLAARPAGAVR